MGPQTPPAMARPAGVRRGTGGLTPRGPVPVSWSLSCVCRGPGVGPTRRVCPWRRSSRHQRPRRCPLRTITCAPRTAAFLRQTREEKLRETLWPTEPHVLTFCPEGKVWGRGSVCHERVIPTVREPTPCADSSVPGAAWLHPQEPLTPHWPMAALGLCPPEPGPPAPRAHPRGQWPAAWPRKPAQESGLAGRLPSLLAEGVSCSVDLCLGLLHFLFSVRVFLPHPLDNAQPTEPPKPPRLIFSNQSD